MAYPDASFCCYFFCEGDEDYVDARISLHANTTCACSEKREVGNGLVFLIPDFVAFRAMRFLHVLPGLPIHRFRLLKLHEIILIG